MIKLSDEFRASELVRIAIFLSPFRNGNSITGKTELLGQSDAVSQPPAYGMGTVGYKIGWVLKSEYEASGGWLNLSPGKDMQIREEPGRYIYSHKSQSNRSVEGWEVSTQHKIKFQPGDKLVNHEGQLVVDIPVLLQSPYVRVQLG